MTQNHRWLTPSQEEAERRNTVNINAETVTNITSTTYPYAYPGEDNSWDVDSFRNGLQVKFHHIAPLDCSFSIIGVDAAIANAIRRILISEIPTLAIEHVFIEDNNSVIVDEVLSHRLGLIPFTGGKQGIREFLRWWKKPKPDAAGHVDPLANSFDYNTVKLSLKVECTHNPDADPEETDPIKKYNNAHVYARDIVFEPTGRQEAYFSGDNAIRPTNPDILIVKMRPGQRIDLECHMHKGIGSDHAKFSPVATASYRLMPKITIQRPILGEDAEKLQRCFPRGVIGIGKVPKKLAGLKLLPNQVTRDGERVENPAFGKAGEKMAVVEDPMRDTMSRECLRHEEFKDKIKLGRVMDHFIFSVESTGQWDSDELVLEALKTLKQKAQTMQLQVENMI